MSELGGSERPLAICGKFAEDLRSTATVGVISRYMETLSLRALNRTTLTRQLLTARSPLTSYDAVSRLVGLQAQNPLDPYLALWSRLDDFDPGDLGRLVEERSLVRIVVMRGTIHLVTDVDALELRPLMQPVLTAEMAHAQHTRHIHGQDLSPTLAFAEPLLTTSALTMTQVRAALAAEFPGIDAAAHAYACRNYFGLVQVPPRGVWGKKGAVRLMTVDGWLGRPLNPTPNIDDLMWRYLEAFGPATVADAAAWTRLTGLKEVFERLRPRLQTFRDPNGRELFDVPDAPRPDDDLPVPVRFLPEYDNVLLSHADRTRFGTEEWRSVSAGFVFRGVLVDGLLRAVWTTEVDGQSVSVTVKHLALTDDESDEVIAEARRVAEFWHPGAELRNVRLEPLVR